MRPWKLFLVTRTNGYRELLLSTQEKPPVNDDEVATLVDLPENEEILLRCVITLGYDHTEALIDLFRRIFRLGQET